MSSSNTLDWALPAAPGRVADMRARLRAARLPASAISGWEGGIDLGWLTGFVAFLADEYDWEADRGRFGARHVMVPFDEAAGNSGQGGLHVTLPENSPGDRLPVLLLHGWPSSGLEFAQVAARLEQAGFYPVVADLPGFGFSAPTQVPAGPRQIAGIVRRAMEKGLGIGRFVVHGNDWGATTAGWLAIDHADAVRGIHISMMGLRPTFGPKTAKPDEAELAWIKSVQKKLAADAGYREIQGTHPNTVAVGLSDSPIGLAAWIAEKMHGWTGGGAEPAVPRQDIAALVTAYWISGAIPSANWIYRAVLKNDETAAPVGGTGDVPVALSFFGNGFFPPPPESWGRRVHNVVDYTTHSTGGHYPALTVPAILSEDIERFAAKFR